jgi:hypothetical protein
LDNVGLLTLGKDRSTWESPSKGKEDIFPFLSRMTRRQLEMLHIMGVVLFPEPELRSVDLSQNLEFTSIVNKIGCVTPGGQIYLSSKVRLCLGLESLRLQGLFFDPGQEVTMTKYFSNDLLQDLAGNAFETTCYLATAWTSIVFRARNHALPKLHPIHWPNLSPPGPSPFVEKSDDDGDDDGLDNVAQLSQSSCASSNASTLPLPGPSAEWR